MVTYMGSKLKYKNEIVPILQNIIDKNNVTSYWEPFVGGANIIDAIKCSSRFGADKNTILIALFQQGQKDFSKIPTSCTREQFNEAREIYKKRILDSDIPLYVQGAYAFFHSFAAKGFCGSYAEAGRSRDVYGERYRRFKSQIPNLKDVVFICSEYKDLDIEDKSLVYCDPPYENTTQYGYAWEKGFNHKEYWDWVRALSQRCYVVCSEQQFPDDFEVIWEKQGFRTVNTNNQKAIEKMGIYKNGMLKRSDF